MALSEAPAAECNPPEQNDIMESKPFLPRFDTDIFISYTHIDNQAFGEDQSQWVSDLHGRLKVRLDQLVGGSVSIWRDAKLTGNDSFADVLCDKLERVGLLVSIVSPRYLQSDWCVRELERFLDAAKRNRGLHVGNRARLFKVVKTPVPVPAQPGEMQRLLGYDFFHELQSGKVREFHLDPSPEARRAYWARLDDLAQDIQTLLLDLRNDEASRPPTEPAFSRETVYLAETSSDMRALRDCLRRDLLDRGFRVLPEAPLPLDGDELRTAVGADLAAAVVSIHPIGTRYGAVPEGEERSLPHLQFDLALERAQAGQLRTLAWIPAQTDAAESRQSELIASIERTQAPARALEVMRVPMESLKTYILEQLETRPPAVEATAAAGAGRRVYLICDRDDVAAVEPLRAYLEQQGNAVTLPFFDGTETEIREDHQDSLVLCDAVLIYYGSGREFWLRTKLRDLLKAPGWGRSQAFQAKAVYVAPPHSPEKQVYRTSEALLIHGAESFTPASLRPFLDLLAAAPGGM